VSLVTPQAAAAPAASHPLHTRLVEVELLGAAAGSYRTRGTIVDLRKRGFVPLAGELQNAGFIHHMRLDLEIDAARRRVERVDVAQPYVAFEAGERTGGDCCRDPAGRLQALMGTTLDASFARRASEHFGGPLGCSHLLTLAQTIGRCLPSALDREEALRASGAVPRRDGERIFKRALFVDGLQAGEKGVEIAVQLSDLHTAPVDAIRQAIDRLELQEEVRGCARIALEGFAIESLEAVERRRRQEELAEGRWRDRAAALEGLRGRRVLPGLGSALFRAFGERPEERLLLDALLHLAPGFVQCVAALTDTSGPRTGPPPAYATSGGGSDACYMWRRGGGLARVPGTTPEPAAADGRAPAGGAKPEAPEAGSGG